MALEKLYINNRRYLGNKYKLLSAIRKVVDENCESVCSFVDIFAGTGSVASAFADKKLIVNDILYSNHICHVAWFSGECYSEKKVSAMIAGYNQAVVDEDNYMSETFADTYFSKDDCRKIGYVREDIERRYSMGEINTRERALLITSLLYAMDKIANTVGHYDAYRKGVTAEAKLKMKMPVPPECAYGTNVCYCDDANKLVGTLEPVDVFFRLFGHDCGSVFTAQDRLTP
ncbi:MAG: DNA adenine methylase, partial [Kiritimatiellae bacterium]|nr:DNA adenine methylase [Kiritimatiellia bacterium]